MKNLLSVSTSSYIRFFAYKALSLIYFQCNDISASLEHALKALSIEKKDVELLELIIDLYVSKKDRAQVMYYIGRLKRVAPKRLKFVFNKIAEYLCEVIQEELQQENQNEALGHLREILCYSPDNYAVLNLYCLINFSSNCPRNNIPVLESALNARPSMKLFVLYHKSSDIMVPEDLFQKMSELINAEEYTELMIAIAAYLGLSNQINKMKTTLLEA